MRKTLIFTMLLALLAVGSIGYVAASIYPLRDQVVVWESESEGASRGDVSAADGLIATLKADYYTALNWHTKVYLGNDLPHTTTDYVLGTSVQKTTSYLREREDIDIRVTVEGTVDTYDFAYLAEGLELGQRREERVFLKDYADFYNTEVELLSAEVIRKRMGTTYDPQTNDFVRNQQTQQKVEQRELTDLVSLGKYKAGSSISELEKELVGFLIKYGHRSLDYRDGRERIHFNVADTIINDIEGDGVVLLDSRYRAILECYKQQRELLPAGEKVPEHHFIEMDNPEASSAAVDILTENDNYKQSRIWKDHDIYIESEEERLGRIIPKTILLYKSKYIEVMIEEKRRELAALDDESDEYMEVLTQINNLLTVRTNMAEQTERNIL